MNSNKKFSNRKINILKASLLVAALLSNQEVSAANFVISGGEIVASMKTLGNNETGLIQQRGLLLLSLDDPSGVIFDSSISAKLTNNGTIHTTAAGTHGVKDLGSYNIILNNHLISTSGNNSRGIFSEGTNTTISNNGLISTTGNSASGIESYGANATINNSGSISIVGDNGFGIDSEGANSTVNNSGSISVHSFGEIGIYSSGANLTINNSGTISATAENGIGITSAAENLTINNSGTIKVSESNATAVFFSNSSSNGTLVNTGKIIANGNAISAIVGSSSTETIILGKGSEIIGSIDLTDGTDSLTVSGNGISSRVATENIESLSIGSGVAGVIIGNDIHTVDPTGAAMLTTNVNKLSLNIQNSVNSHNKQASITNKESPIWMNIFNSNFDRGDDSKNLSYRNQSFGVVGGYDLDSKGSTGLLFGISSGDMKTKSASFKTDVNSFFFGGYKNLDLAKSTSLSFNLIAGYERYNSERTLVDNINGYQVAKSNLNNFFITPSATLEHKFKINEYFELNPIAKLSYTSSFFGENNESGSSASNIKTKARRAEILNSRIGVNAILTLKNTKLELGTGFDTRLIKEARVRASINNNSFRYDTNNDKNVNGHYIRAAAYIIDLKNFSLLGSFEKRKADGGENEYLGQLGARYRF